MKPGFQPFSSYVLKMFCIHHDINCTIKTKIVSKCLDEVLDLMAEYCENDELPNVFNKRLTYLYISDTESEFRICMLDGLRKIKELAVANPTQANFSKVIADVVEQSSSTVDLLRNRVLKEEDRRFRAEQRQRTANEPATFKGEKSSGRL
ncbi:uncharacterized protein LOC127840914 [Dreissena polymorpha]|nr:uncharacterized protein LOC127840914 [Dreissena polymorpha]